METTRARYAMAEVLLGLDRPHEALTRFEALKADAAFQTRALQGMGLAQLAIGNAGEAATQLDRAVTADASLWRAWAGLGRAHDQQKNWAAAAAAYERGLAANPGSPMILNNQGMSLLLQHRYAEAAAAFEQAIAHDPTLETARTNLRIALAWQGRYDEALVGLQPEERANSLNNIGFVAMLRGDHRSAQRYFAQAMEISPTYHQGAAANLEALKVLATSKVHVAPQTADAPTPRRDSDQAIYQFSGGAGTGFPCMRFDTLPPWTTVHHIGHLVQIWMASINRYNSLWRCAWTVRKSRAFRRSKTAGNWFSGVRTAR